MTHARRTARIPAAALAALLALAGCSRQEADWGEARRADTVAAYQQYLDDYPHGAYVKEARARLGELVDEREWRRAQRLDTPEAYQVYLGGHPDGRHAAAAREKLSDFLLARAPAGADDAAEEDTVLPPPPPEGDAAAVAPEPGPAGVPRAAPGVGRGPSGTLEALASPAGVYRLQLGAFAGGEGAARSAWQRLVARHGTELGGLAPRIDVVTRDGRRLWRLQAGPLDGTTAVRACERLRAAGSDCAVVKP